MHLHFTYIKIHTSEVKCSWQLTHNHITEENWCQHFHCTVPKNSKKISIFWLLIDFFYLFWQQMKLSLLLFTHWIIWPKLSPDICSFWGFTIILFTFIPLSVLLIIFDKQWERYGDSYLQSSLHMLRANILLGSAMTEILWDLPLPFLGATHEPWGKRKNWDG